MTETVLMTINDLCDRYGITRTRAYLLLGAGKISAVKLAGRTLIQTASADAFFTALPVWTPACGPGAVA